MRFRNRCLLPWQHDYYIIMVLNAWPTSHAVWANTSTLNHVVYNSSLQDHTWNGWGTQHHVDGNSSRTVQNMHWFTTALSAEGPHDNWLAFKQKQCVLKLSLLTLQLDVFEVTPERKHVAKNVWPFLVLRQEEHVWANIDLVSPIKRISQQRSKAHTVPFELQQIRYNTAPGEHG